MTSQEFAEIRKKLAKTQKEIATLLGVSLKAICSYEQGWRPVPGHVTRQLLFLLARKQETNPKQCWEIKNCPGEKKSKCPAWEFNAGEYCWFVNGTICDDTIYGTLNEKLTICRACEVMKNIK